MLKNVLRALPAGALLLPLGACGDPPADATGDVCPIAMAASRAEVPAGETPLNVGFTGAPPPGASIDRGRPVRASVPATLAERVTVWFAADAAQPDANAVAGRLSANLTGGVAYAEVTLSVPLRVAGAATCGVASVRVVPAAVPTPVLCADPNALRGRLQEIVDGATLALRTPDARLFTRVPLVPIVPELTLPDVGRLSGDVLTVPFVSGTGQVRFRVEWGVEGAPAFAVASDGRTPVALGEQSAQTSVVLRVVPPVVPVPEGDAEPAGAVTPRVTARVHATLAACNVDASARTPAGATAPAVALPLPRLLALYRAPDFGTGYPAWRDVPSRNSGVVVFGTPTDLRAPTVPLVGLLAGGAVPVGEPSLGGLGTRLAEIAGPVPTPAGPAGLSELPAGAVPAIAGPVGALRRLAETIGQLTRSYASLAALHAPNGRYARLESRASVSDLGGVNLIDGEGFGTLAVHVQDEAEAALMIGPSGTAADLFTLANFNPRIQGPFHVDSGVVRLTTARDGYVAVVPDLAVAGPDCGAAHNGWLPVTSDRYAAAHPRPAGDGYGSIRVHVAIDGDRGVSEAPNVRRDAVPELRNDQFDALNRQREHTMSRTMSSLRLGDGSVPITGPTC